MQQKAFDAHAHTLTHIFITIPEATPAEHKVRNSIEKLCAELCTFFFAAICVVYSETKSYATGADSWLHNSALIWPRAVAPGVHFGFCYCVLWLFYAFAIAIGYNKSCSTFSPAFFCSVAPLGLVYFLYYLFLMSFNYEYNSGRGWRFTGPTTQLLS